MSSDVLRCPLLLASRSDINRVAMGSDRDAPLALPSPQRTPSLDPIRRASILASHRYGLPMQPADAVAGTSSPPPRRLVDALALRLDLPGVPAASPCKQCRRHSAVARRAVESGSYCGRPWRNRNLTHFCVGTE